MAARPYTNKRCERVNVFQKPTIDVTGEGRGLPAGSSSFILQHLIPHTHITSYIYIPPHGSSSTTYEHF